MKLTKLITLYIVAVICAAFLLIAASPYQTEPPAPVSIFDQAIDLAVAALVAAVAWLVFQVRALKAQATAQLRLFTPDAWEWVLDDLAPILVKAVCQALPQAQAEAVISGLLTLLWAELLQRGIAVAPAKQTMIGATFLDMIGTFYAEFTRYKAD